ncbi:hypothetical protein F2P81_003567 [Scophthalmus maximus]|uniref:Uncharacterized protein n=1 Tax=Scophthalmus maximus TaxID=52904 RepID=A0A6A4THT1_SCOMX|nr:hypothetical protein F2P81_003567 [Scophthalmus maximus]
MGDDSLASSPMNGRRPSGTKSYICQRFRKRKYSNGNRKAVNHKPKLMSTTELLTINPFNLSIRHWKYYTLLFLCMGEKEKKKKERELVPCALLEPDATSAAGNLSPSCCTRRHDRSPTAEARRDSRHVDSLLTRH